MRYWKYTLLKVVMFILAVYNISFKVRARVIPKFSVISSAWSSGSHSIQSLILLILLLILVYFPNILLKPLKTNV